MKAVADIFTDSGLIVLSLCSLFSLVEEVKQTKINPHS